MAAKTPTSRFITPPRRRAQRNGRPWPAPRTSPRPGAEPRRRHPRRRRPTPARMASASAAGSPGGTNHPDVPCSTSSATPPTSVATIGRPAAIASMTAEGSPSNRDGRANTSARASSDGDVAAVTQQMHSPAQRRVVNRVSEPRPDPDRHRRSRCAARAFPATGPRPPLGLRCPSADAGGQPSRHTLSPAGMPTADRSAGARIPPAREIDAVVDDPHALGRRR